MDAVTDTILDEEVPRARLALLLKHFSELDDAREPWRVLYPLDEVLLLVTCATIAVVRRFRRHRRLGQASSRLPAAVFGIPSRHSLRALAALRSSIGSIRSCSAAASRLGSRRCGRVGTPSSPSTARPRAAPMTAARGSKPSIRSAPTPPTQGWSWRSSACRKRPTRSPPFRIFSISSAEAKQLEGALVTIDAMGCQVEIADKIVAHKADYLLALKGNQPTLEADVADYFRTAPAAETVTKTTVEKGHGRIETRTYTASSVVDWIASDRSYPGQPRFTNIKTIVKVHARTEYADRCSFDTRYYISSAPRDIERIASGARGHWGVESMHWLLDVEFKDDLSRYRTGHGAKNMAIVRRFALGLVRADKSKGSVKTRRKPPAGTQTSCSKSSNSPER